VVAEVDEGLPLVERLLADLGERDHDLDAVAVAGLQRGEAQLAADARVHDAARDADQVARCGVGLKVFVELAHRADRRGDRHADGVGLCAARDEALALREAHGLLLADLLSGRLRLGGVLVRHVYSR
jgi:hypothetical protein